MSDRKTSIHSPQFLEPQQSSASSSLDYQQLRRQSDKLEQLRRASDKRKDSDCFERQKNIYNGSISSLLQPESESGEVTRMVTMEMVMGTTEDASPDPIAELDQQILQNQQFSPGSGKFRSGSESPLMNAERARSDAVNENFLMTFAQPASEEGSGKVSKPEMESASAPNKNGGKKQQSSSAAKPRKMSQFCRVRESPSRDDYRPRANATVEEGFCLDSLRRGLKTGATLNDGEIAEVVPAEMATQDEMASLDRGLQLSELPSSEDSRSSSSSSDEEEKQGLLSQILQNGEEQRQSSNSVTPQFFFRLQDNMEDEQFIQAPSFPKHDVEASQKHTFPASSHSTSCLPIGVSIGSGHFGPADLQDQQTALKSPEIQKQSYASPFGENAFRQLRLGTQEKPVEDSSERKFSFLSSRPASKQPTQFLKLSNPISRAKASFQTAGSQTPGTGQPSAGRDNRLKALLLQAQPEKQHPGTADAKSASSAYQGRMSAMRARMGRGSFLIDQNTEQGDDGSSPLNDISMTKSDLSGLSADGGKNFSSTSLMNTSVMSQHDRMMMAIKSKSRDLQQRHSALIGHSFESKYTLGKELGQGMHSTVFECFAIDDTSKTQPFAVKWSRDDNKEKLEAFKREYELTRLLEHPNVVNSIELFSNDITNEVHLIMKHIKGKQLDKLVTRRSAWGAYYSEKQLKAYAEQVLKAVDHVHSKRLVHRDIKPDNFVVDGADNLVLIDFNTSRRYDPETENMMTRTGEVQFNAPEILEGSPYDNKVDIWGVGIILYFLLSGGFMPFETKNEAALIDQIKRKEPAFDLPNFQRISEQALALLKQTLSKDPKDRPTAAECLEHSWFKEKSLDSYKKESSLRKRPTQLGATFKASCPDLELLRVGLDFSPLLEQQRMIKESTKSLECCNLLRSLPIPRSASIEGEKMKAVNEKEELTPSTFDDERKRGGSYSQKSCDIKCAQMLQECSALLRAKLK